LGVAPPEGYASGARLKVNAPPAAGAIVNEQTRVAVDDFIPHRVEPLNIPDFADALPVRHVGGLPEGQRVNVKVIAVDINAGRLDDFAEVVCEPLTRSGQSEIIEAVAFLAAEDPIGMFAVNAASLGYALRFEPDDEL
jgi:hypothetical protein